MICNYLSLFSLRYMSIKVYVLKEDKQQLTTFLFYSFQPCRKFEDGTAPTKEIVARWLKLNDEVFYESPTPDRCIAVHCVSGIGRAPVIVAPPLPFFLQHLSFTSTTNLFTMSLSLSTTIEIKKAFQWTLLLTAAALCFLTACFFVFLVVF